MIPQVILSFSFFINCHNVISARNDNFNNSYLASANVKSSPEWDDAFLNFDQIVLKRGYPVETHEVTTEDGYILTIFRIPYGRSNSSVRKRPIVFLQHGYLGSSVDWIIQGSDKSLAYMLADKGYDVWVGNARGSFYSRKHVTMNPDIDTVKYWDFTWNEIGYYDIPAMIDYILWHTGQEKLFHVGYSQGSITFYVMTTSRPEYNDKIRAHFSLSPVAFMKNSKSPVWRAGAAINNLLLRTIQLRRRYEILPRSNKFPGFCASNRINYFICENSLFSMYGFNHKQMNKTLLPIIYGHIPAGGSAKQLLHFFQLISSGHFRKWDYGPGGNLIHYRSFVPPAYDLSKVTAPVYLFNSKNDWLSAEKDVAKLQSHLPNVKGKFLNPDPKWNHIDYTYATDADRFIYIPLISILNQICSVENC